MSANSGSDLDGDLVGNLSRFGCWNVRTLTMNGREQELVAEMKK